MSNVISIDRALDEEFAYLVNAALETEDPIVIEELMKIMGITYDEVIAEVNAMKKEGTL